MKVRFLQTRIVQAEGGETFHKDQEYDLPEPSARRWIERGVAELASDAPATAPGAGPGNTLASAAKSAFARMTRKKPAH